ncbi:unnamed protein product, partial [Prorocentrum cordatum]
AAYPRRAARARAAPSGPPPPIPSPAGLGEPRAHPRRGHGNERARHPREAPARGHRAHRDLRAEDGRDVPRTPDELRGQHERHAGGRHRDGPRRQGHQPRAGVPPRLADPLLHPPRHAAARADVQEEGPRRRPWRLRPGREGARQGAGPEGPDGRGGHAEVSRPRGEGA